MADYHHLNHGTLTSFPKSGIFWKGKFIGTELPLWMFSGVNFSNNRIGITKRPILLPELEECSIAVSNKIWSTMAENHVPYGKLKDNFSTRG